MSHKPCLLLYLQHTKAAATAEARAAEHHTELAYEGGERLRAEKRTFGARFDQEKHRMAMLTGSWLAAQLELALRIQANDRKDSKG